MTTMLPSWLTLVHLLAPAFTQPALLTHCQLACAWLLCLGTPTLRRLARTAQAGPAAAPAPSDDRVYNFFARSAWTVTGLAQRLLLACVQLLSLTGPLHLLIDDTLLHKRGGKVWGLGWFRDAVASTRKRVATASGHNWVVLALAVPVPFVPGRWLAVPVLMALHRKGKGQPSCALLARRLLNQVIAWYPDRELIVIGDGGYANQALLRGLPPQVTVVGRLRGDACLYQKASARRPGPGRGRPAVYGRRTLSPSQAAATADRKRLRTEPWCWRHGQVTVYQEQRALQWLSWQACWPRVLGPQEVQVVVARNPAKPDSDTYLFTTALGQSAQWVVEKYALRWEVEVLFRASKQVLEIEGPQHWCQGSVAKVAPWVWLLQGQLVLWYLTEGHGLPEALEVGEELEEWDSELSLRHMRRVFQRAQLRQRIKTTSQDVDELQDNLQQLVNYVLTAA